MPASTPPTSTGWTTPLAARIATLSEDEWNRNPVRMLGTSNALAEAQSRLERFAQFDQTLLLLGESGVGKELFAQATYLLSSRRGEAFLRVNCAQFTDENLLISELFGHKKGAFTGASSDRKGLFEEADRGVLFLDEIGELTPRAQAALLRVLGVGEIVRLGESRARRVDVRVVAATNRDLREMVSDGTFREDLYYRLGHLVIRIPPVRERGGDWELIAKAHLLELSRRYRNAKVLSSDAIARLSSYPWPGNVREIRALLDMTYCLCANEIIEPKDFESELSRRPHGQGGSIPPGAPPIVSDTPRGVERSLLWERLRKRYLDRELNRDEMRAIIARALVESGGSYKRALCTFGLAESEYLRFMDFLRHHRLKPQNIVAEA